MTLIVYNEILIWCIFKWKVSNIKGKWIAWQWILSSYWFYTTSYLFPWMIILKWHTAYLKADLTQQDNRNTQNIRANADCDKQPCSWWVMVSYVCLQTHWIIGNLLKWALPSWFTESKNPYICAHSQLILKHCCTFCKTKVQLWFSVMPWITHKSWGLFSGPF